MTAAWQKMTLWRMKMLEGRFAINEVVTLADTATGARPSVAQTLAILLQAVPSRPSVRLLLTEIPRHHLCKRT